MHMALLEHFGRCAPAFGCKVQAACLATQPQQQETLRLLVGMGVG